MTALVIREATQADYEPIHQLLELNGLHPAGILTAGSRYWVAINQVGSNSERIVGVVGLEYGPEAVLLRSAAVYPALHGQGIGSRLFAQAYAIASADNRRIVYCFSTDAGEYWIRQGFYQVPVPELCAAVPDSFQVHYYEQLGWLPTEVAWRRDLVR